MARKQSSAVRDVVGAAMLGVGAILQRKADPTEHWSTGPTVTVVTDAAPDAGGEPSPRDAAAVA